MTIYSALVRPLLFQLDPEAAHHLAIAAGARLGWAAPAMQKLTRRDRPSLTVEVAGLRFPTPIGLAAGFDKSGSAIAALAGLGFGSVEIGSISIDPSPAIPSRGCGAYPMIRRSPVAYGLPNDGAAIISQRLKAIRLPVPLGINLVVTIAGAATAPLGANEIIGEYVAAAKA